MTQDRGAYGCLMVDWYRPDVMYPGLFVPLSEKRTALQKDYMYIREGKRRKLEDLEQERPIRKRHTMERTRDGRLRNETLGGR